MSKRIIDEAGGKTLTLAELSAFVDRAYGAGCQGDDGVFVAIPLVSMNNEKCRIRKIFVEAS